MPISQGILPLMRCPKCRGQLRLRKSNLICARTRQHTYSQVKGIFTFTEIGAGKYDRAYAARYATLWAYGFVTLHLGLNEPLYRAISSLVADSLTSFTKPPIIVDSGCGVGRTSGDCAKLAFTGQVLAFDASLAMLQLAKKITCKRETVKLKLKDFGFSSLLIPGRGLNNVFLARADVQCLPLSSKCADLVLSINVADRLINGPEVALKECHRILRLGGKLVFATPMNWTRAKLWKRFPDRDTLLDCINNCGFKTTTWFDQLHYREILDSRGSFEEFNTLVISATAI